MAAESEEAGGGEAIRVRLNYDPLALFASEVRTDADGHAFEGRATENVVLDLPMQLLQASADGNGGDLPLILQKDGQGRLYYRLGLRHAPTELRLDAAALGFTIERVYEAVDDPADVRRDEDGVWRIRAGARVRVKLTMVAPARRVHVALVDPLPAGLKILNPELAVTENPREEPDRNRGRWWGKLVSASEPARRAGRGHHAIPVGRCLPIQLHGQGHDPRPIRGAPKPSPRRCSRRRPSEGREPIGSLSRWTKSERRSVLRSERGPA